MLHSQPGMIPSFPVPLEGEVNGPHPGLWGRELHPAVSAIPETTWMEPQPDATPIQGILGQRIALGKYKHAQFHDKGKQ